MTVCTERVEIMLEAVADADKVAVRDPGGSLTFAELIAQAARLTAALRDLGVAPGDAVLLVGIAGRDAITAMLGIFGAGAYVVPIDPGYPAERAELMARTTGASIGLECAGPRAQWSTVPGVTMHPVQPLVVLGAATSAPLAIVASEDTAYVLFTSGSTGVPKAVAVPHRALVRLCVRESVIRCRPDDVFLVNTVLTFDPSMLEIWSALIVGASVVCAASTTTSVAQTCDLITASGASIAVLTPAMFALVVDSFPHALAVLRRLIVGGDVMPARQARELRRSVPGLQIVNCYGPTENSVVTTAFDLAGWDEDDPSVPIGHAVAGARCYVLSPDGSEVGVGEVGELYIGGDRLAAGYVGDPGLTAERFLPDPFVPGARMYRSGDRVVRHPSAGLTFSGRLDGEIKVRGFRVNLAEVAALVAAVPGVAEAVGVAVGDGNDREALVFTRLAGFAVEARELRAHVAAHAPQHLVPAEIIVVEQFPLTHAGKVDTDALLAARSTDEPVSDHGEFFGATDLRAELAGMWERRCGSTSGAEDFFTAGGSSLDLIKLLNDVDLAYSVQLDFEEVYGIRGFGEFADMVATAMSASAVASIQGAS